ncbi:MAG: hypothetical protein AAFR42_20010, partial [Cyanobacteria bacterium J06628_6]
MSTNPLLKARHSRMRKNSRLSFLMPKRSIGAGLFLSIMGGAVVSLGSISILFYQVLEKQSENQI